MMYGSWRRKTSVLELAVFIILWYPTTACTLRAHMIQFKSRQMVKFLVIRLKTEMRLKFFLHIHVDVVEILFLDKPGKVILRLMSFREFNVLLQMRSKIVTFLKCFNFTEPLNTISKGNIIVWGMLSKNLIVYE